MVTAEPIRVLSYGGGTQSAALALMSAAGELQRLDAVVFADTGGELPATYEYAAYVADRLEAAGIPFLRVSAGNLERAVLGLERPATGGAGVTLPAFVRNPDGSDGKVAGYTCSYDYKRRQVRKATRSLVQQEIGGRRGAWKRLERPVEMWIGFSADEVGRAKTEKECCCSHVRATHDAGGPCGNARCSCERFVAWRINRFPLLELGWRREDTVRWFTEAGHPVPVRSACWFCPNQGPARWRMIRRDHPELFARAIAIDAAHREQGRATGFVGDKFLHRQRVPLPLVDLHAPSGAVAGQAAMFDDAEIDMLCEGEVCFT